MSEEQEILALLDRHLRSIWGGDLGTYTATTAPDVTFYEWYISTQRIDGLDFHLRETAANFRAAEARRQAGQRYEIEHEVLQPKVQLYGDIALVTYTLLMRYTTDDGVRHTEHNETRVFHRRPEGWQLVHCHKSPMWPAPHAPTIVGRVGTTCATHVTLNGLTTQSTTRRVISEGSRLRGEMLPKGCFAIADDLPHPILNR